MRGIVFGFAAFVFWQAVAGGQTLPAETIGKTDKPALDAEVKKTLAKLVEAVNKATDEARVLRKQLEAQQLAAERLRIEIEKGKAGGFRFLPLRPPGEREKLERKRLPDGDYDLRIFQSPWV